MVRNEITLMSSHSAIWKQLTGSGIPNPVTHLATIQVNFVDRTRNGVSMRYDRKLRHFYCFHLQQFFLLFFIYPFSPNVDFHSQIIKIKQPFLMMRHAFSIGVLSREASSHSIHLLFFETFSNSLGIIHHCQLLRSIFSYEQTLKLEASSLCHTQKKHVLKVTINL